MCPAPWRPLYLPAHLVPTALDAEASPCKVAQQQMEAVGVAFAGQAAGRQAAERVVGRQRAVRIGGVRRGAVREQDAHSVDLAMRGGEVEHTETMRPVSFERAVHRMALRGGPLYSLLVVGIDEGGARGAGGGAEEARQEQKERVGRAECGQVEVDRQRVAARVPAIAVGGGRAATGGADARGGWRRWLVILVRGARGNCLRGGAGRRRRRMRGRRGRGR